MMCMTTATPGQIHEVPASNSPAPASAVTRPVDHRRIIYIRTFCQMLGRDEDSPLDRSTVWRWIQKGIIAAPLQIGPNRVGWTAEYIDQWLASRPQGMGPQPTNLQAARPRALEGLRRYHEERKRAKEAAGAPIGAHA
jgi:predicted DNA-binding transcriptional regulator AlpA